MRANLCFVACESFRREMAAVMESEPLAEVALGIFPARCERGPLDWSDIQRALPAADGVAIQACVLGGCCTAGLRTSPGAPPGCRLHPASQCHALVADTDVVERYQAEGAYLLTPGWLADWRGHVEAWGFTEETARAFFGESTSRLLLLDTGVDPTGCEHLRQFASFVGLPHDSVPVGLGHLRGLLTRIALEWRLEQERDARTRATADLRRERADHTAVAQFLERLAGVSTESGVIERAVELLVILSAPGRVAYLAVREGRPDHLVSQPAQLPDEEATRERLAAFPGAHAWTRSGSGFVVRISRDDETLGILEIDRVAFPQHRQQYLNVALTLAGPLALAVANARYYERLQAANADLEAANDELQAQSEELLAQQVALEEAAAENARLCHEAQEANAAKDQFLAVLSHELRNPLSPILAGVDVLRRTLARDARAERTLAIIERNAKLQARLVNDLLDLSRIARGKVNLQRAPFALDSVVNAAVQAKREEAEKAGLTIHADVQAGFWVLGDLDRLEQVVLNLVGNAIKFTPPGGEIRVAVRECGEDRARETGDRQEHNPPVRPSSPASGQWARVIVEDTGIGIDRALLPNLFDMFRQGEVGGQGQPGLGIGLSLVRSLTEMHGGHVWAESEGPGHGSRFAVELPLIAAPTARASADARCASGRRLRVLLVEDNPDTRTMLQENLEALGCYSVQAVADGEEGLALLTQGKPDLILSDIGLPQMDGYEFLRRAREMPGLGEVPAFAITGYGRDDDVRQAREAGFVGHFVKPVDVAALDLRIREWLSAGQR